MQDSQKDYPILNQMCRHSRSRKTSNSEKIQRYFEPMSSVVDSEWHQLQDFFVEKHLSNLSASNGKFVSICQDLQISIMASCHVSRANMSTLSHIRRSIRRYLLSGWIRMNLLDSTDALNFFFPELSWIIMASTCNHPILVLLEFWNPWLFRNCWVMVR